MFKVRYVGLAFLLMLLLGSCQSSMVLYRNQLLVVSQIKSDALTRLRVFNCQHQLRVLLSMKDKNPAEALSEYRVRRHQIDQEILQNAQDDLIANTQFATANDEKFKQLTDGLYDRSIELSKKIDNFMVDEQKILATHK